MKNHEKSKTKHAEVAQSVSNKKSPRRENVASALGTEGNQKKTKTQKNRFFFFFCFFGTSPPNPSNNQLQKYLSLRSAYGAYFCS